MPKRADLQAVLRGVNFGRRSPDLGGQICTPKHSDASRWQSAQGLAAADTIQLRELGAASAALGAQFQNLSEVLGRDVTPIVTTLANRAAQFIGERAAAMEQSPKERARAWIAGALGTPIAAHLGLSALGGYVGGPGLMAGARGMMGVAGPVGMVGGSAAFGYQMFRNYQKLAETSARTRAVFEHPGGKIDRSPAGLARALELQRLAAGASTGGFDIGFGIGPEGRFAGGVAAGSVAGSSAFGFGNFGVADGAAFRGSYSKAPGALHDAPASFAAIAAALRAGPAQPVELKGAAEITNRIIIEPSSEFVSRVEQEISARGNLRANTGVTMPMGR